MLKNSPQDFAPSDGLLHGIYRGVVENNKDPEEIGRCQVRVFGVHSPNKSQTEADGIPTDHLPWAEPAGPLFGGGVSGIGNWSIPVQGSMVYVFFERGHLLNPRYFATAPGKPTEKTHGFTSEQGFSDPDGVYPDKLGESDVNRLARGDKSGTAISEREANVRGPEPTPSFGAKYPHNNVLETPSGITIELDDTQGAERIHIYHPSKSFIEINESGRMIVRNTGDKFTLTDGDLTVDIQGDSTKEIQGDSTKEIGGSKTVNISGECTVQVGGGCTIQAGGDVTIEAGGNAIVNAAQILLNS